MAGRPRYDAATEREHRHDWWGVVLDSVNPPRLGAFYAAVSGWPIVDATESWVTLRPHDGVAYLAIQLSEGYTPPTWPNVPGQPQMMMHLDIEVDDLDVAVQSALDLGARLAEHQPQAHCPVLLDPDGHPFCLYRGT
jgi:catechol 2,3-dioxygenase-like lactoylglutathione lyase family enzyme